MKGVKLHLYPDQGVVALLSRYLEAYRLDVAQALRRGSYSPDYNNLVQGARGQHYDPFIYEAARATGREPKAVFESLIMIAAYEAEKGFKKPKNHRASNRTKPGKL